MARKALAAACFLCSFGAVTVESAAQMFWRRLQPGNAPPPRRLHAMASEPASGGVLLFGGQGPTGSGHAGTMNDTWRYVNGAWQQLFPAHSPPPMHRHVMSYHAAAGGVVVLGPTSPLAGSPLQTWVFDGTDWQHIQGNVPSPRAGLAMAHDARRDRIVIFGGYPARLQWLRETWEFDGTNWAQVSTSGPSARSASTMFFDPDQGVTVLYGGGGPSGALSDTWRWDGTTWSNIPTANSPIFSSPGTVAWDPRRRRAIINGAWSYGPRDWTWEFDGIDWRESVPRPRVSFFDLFQAAFDASTQELIRFGGQDRNFNYFAYTEAYTARQPSRIAELGTGCAPSGSRIPQCRADSACIAGNHRFTVHVDSLDPADPTFLLLGLPAPQTTIGPCETWIAPAPTPIGLLGTADSTGMGTFSVPIPYHPALLGTTVHAQGGSITAPGVTIPHTMSATLALTIGG